ncbi:MAG: hydroxymethylbilane synthase, partial [Cyanophyceae cyanobacterium]
MSATATETSTRTIRIGSRKSQLALVQTYWVRDTLKAAFPQIEFEVCTLETQGDKVLNVALSKIGDKGLFTRELEDGMRDNIFDFAVHSLKDLPTNLPEGLMLGCVTERVNPADAVAFNEKFKGLELKDLPEGSVVGTSSLRRLAQLRHHYPHLTFKDIRGNVNTRLRKLDDGEYDATILAVAGLERLELGNRIDQILPPEVYHHAVGQGAFGIKFRSGDQEIHALLKVHEPEPSKIRCVA